MQLVRRIVEALERSTDRKVCQLAKLETSKRGARWKPTIKNTVGTLAKESCPGATEWCMKVCYAFNTERFYKAVHSLVGRNTARLKSFHALEMRDSYVRTIAEYKADLGKAQAKAPFILADVFRFKWDGDVASEDEANAISYACRQFPDTQFWIYTRSFEWAHLLDAPNLAVYLSVDSHNADQAIPGYRYAFCADTWDETEALSYKVAGRNSPRCPELTGRYPLVVDKGNGFGVGACVECGLCIFGRNHVRFAAKK